MISGDLDLQTQLFFILFCHYILLWPGCILLFTSHKLKHLSTCSHSHNFPPPNFLRFILELHITVSLWHYSSCVNVICMEADCVCSIFQSHYVKYFRTIASYSDVTVNNDTLVKTNMPAKQQGFLPKQQMEQTVRSDL